MTDTTAIETHPGHPLGKSDRPDIRLPNGDTLRPRKRMAAEKGISERTLSRMGCESTLVAGVSYVSERSFLRIVSSGLRAPKRRRR